MAYYDPACCTCCGKDLAGTTWQCGDHLRRERDRLRTELAEWRDALDELHVVNWIGIIDGLTPREAVRLLLDRALDQDRDTLRAQLAEAQTRLRGLVESIKAAGHEDVASLFRVTRERDEARALLRDIATLPRTIESRPNDAVVLTVPTRVLARLDALLE